MILILIVDLTHLEYREGYTMDIHANVMFSMIFSMEIAPRRSELRSTIGLVEYSTAIRLL